MTATRNNRTAISIARHSAPDNERRPIPLRLGVVTKVAAANSQDVSASQTILPALSVRAENVLKILAPELPANSLHAGDGPRPICCWKG